MKFRANELLIAVFLVLLASYCFCQEWQKPITPGINYFHIKKDTPSSFLHIHILKADLKDNKIKVKPALAGGVIGDLERTSDIAIRNNAVAAINGSFFELRRKYPLPIGLMIIDGQVVSKSILERTTIGITGNNDIYFGMPKTKGYAMNMGNKKSVQIWGVNRPRKKDEVIIYTNEYGETTRTNSFGKEILVNSDGSVEAINNGNSAIPKDGFIISLHGWSRDFVNKTKVGDRIGLVYDLTEQWKNVKQAITGGPLLVKDGRIVHKESIENEKFRGEMLPPNSRTAIGVTKDKQLIFVVVDKQYPVSAGVTYDELARIMIESGAENAMGLDGGHASTMYVNGRVVNFPLKKYEASVSNAIIVTYDGWKLASAMKPAYKYTYIYVYKPPSDELIEALRVNTGLSPTAYIARPEDFGMWGLYDLYNRVIRPVVPEPITRQLFSRP